MKYSVGLLAIASVLLCLSISLNLWSGVLLACGELVTGLAALPIFLEIFSKIEEKFNFSRILAAVTLISTGLGTFNTYQSFDSYSSWLNYLATLYIDKNSSVAITQLYVIAYCVFLITADYFLNPRSAKKNFNQVTETVTLKLVHAFSSLANEKKQFGFISFFYICFAVAVIYGAFGT